MKPGMKKHGTENRKNNETGKHGKNTEGITLNKVPSNYTKRIRADLFSNESKGSTLMLFC
jgi:hypothetical protein